MSSTAIFIVFAVAFGVVCLVLHIAMIVQGFKLSVKWGLISLLVPGGAFVFAFAKSGRKKLAIVFLASFIVSAVCGSIACYKTAQAAAAYLKAEAEGTGMKEFDKQVKDLDNLGDIQL
jgi:hypothetical protein